MRVAWSQVNSLFFLIIIYDKIQTFIIKIKFQMKKNIIYIVSSACLLLSIFSLFLGFRPISELGFTDPFVLSCFLFGILFLVCSAGIYFMQKWALYLYVLMMSVTCFVLLFMIFAFFMTIGFDMGIVPVLIVISAAFAYFAIISIVKLWRNFKYGKV